MLLCGALVCNNLVRPPLCALSLCYAFVLCLCAMPVFVVPLHEGFFRYLCDGLERWSCVIALCNGLVQRYCEFLL